MSKRRKCLIVAGQFFVWVLKGSDISTYGQKRHILNIFQAGDLRCRPEVSRLAACLPRSVYSSRSHVFVCRWDLLRGQLVILRLTHRI